MIDEDEEEKKKEPKGNVFSPESWDSYLGQEKVKERLQTQIQAAMSRYEQLDHCLILGPSGAGKTSLARLIAAEHGVNFIDVMITPGMPMAKFRDLLIKFDSEGGGICFCDEIHNFTKKEQHYLYSILEDGYIAFDNGKRYYFENQVTIVAATTDERDLTKALRGRFGSPYRLADYDDIEMAQIVERMAYKVNVEVPSREVCYLLGRAAAGSPRQAADLVKMARDLGSMDPMPIFKMSEITPDGLTSDHIKYLNTLKSVGGRAGLELISNHSMLAKDDLVNLERLLVRKDLVIMTGKGREITVKGHAALNAAKEIMEK